MTYTVTTCNHYHANSNGYWQGNILRVSTDLLREYNMTGVTRVTPVAAWLLCMCYACAMLCYPILRYLD